MEEMEARRTPAMSDRKPQVEFSYAATGGRTPIGSRKSAANGGGLSSHQLKQAIRVTNAPKGRQVASYRHSKAARIGGESPSSTLLKGARENESTKSRIADW
jgi:hypothetical protein